ncbi:conserved hypothetical protein [Vibrio nigripulchritudo MADA3029]|uniref:Lcl C-terminal domain-containing protein n=1 Tax=Vibrio nigripulchritudo TaxID=28173 RepID=UPI0003B1A25A|nr:DUF1566 domain-containing protein [Vibrio nigripulchritudo]CCN45330.1 conserved hypothetical protein [Vibrio nigripulchritudo MADA3020]CCN51778.1 conserved hypothetical protein [Vibrio nigripulchritudo MADA3021]CCN61942.1 conserved hypothetical protein [Vibrio nigripulchritudo MADA3029]
MKKWLLSSALLLVSTGVIAQTCSLDISRSAPNSRFVVEDSGIVKDLKTGLIWMRCPVGKTWDTAQSSCTGDSAEFLWQPALQRANDIANSPLDSLYQFAGVTNWRIPNIKELQSLTEKGCHSPALNSKVFPNFLDSGGNTTEVLWSSTAAGSGDAALVFNAKFGEVYTQEPNRAGANYAIMMVADSK